MVKSIPQPLPYQIFFLTEGVELPDTGNYYIVARDGVYLHKDTGLIKATVKVKTISFLDPLAATATLRLPIIPSRLAAQALLFFRRVFLLHYSEATLLIHYSEKNGYLLSCPEQEVNSTRVIYKPTERIEGFRLVGSIHSHCNFDAFHSEIDIADEETFDGLHITIGRVDQPFPTLSTTVVVNSNRFPMEPDNVIDGLRVVNYKPKPRISHRRPDITRIEGEVYAKKKDFISLDQQSNKYYDIVLPYNQDYRNVSFPGNWLSRVKIIPDILSCISLWSKPNSKELEKEGSGL